MEWDDLPVRVASEEMPWPVDGDRPPRAGVSAFGLSGTNAHVIVEGHGAADEPAAWAPGAAMPVPTGAGSPVDGDPLGDRPMRVLPLSAKSDEALRELARRYLRWCDERLPAGGDAPSQWLADMAWTAGVGRRHFGTRAGLAFQDVESLRAGLQALAEGGATHQAAEGGSPKIAFAYAGGGQFAGMGRDLYRQEPAVRAVLDRCDALVAEQRSGSLLDVMFGSAGDIDDAAWGALSTLALQCALTALWDSVGVRPNVVLGDGLGEIAAGQAAGVFGLEEALQLVAARDMESSPIDVQLSPPTLELVAGKTGRIAVADEVLEGAYWQRRSRAAAATDRSVATLAELGVGAVIEIGPQPMLTPNLAALWPKNSASAPPAVLPGGIRSGAMDGDGAFARAVAAAYEAGLAISYSGLFAGESRSRVALPGYPFQRRRHWIGAPGRDAGPS